MFKRLLCLAITVLLILSVFSVTAFAEDEQYTIKINIVAQFSNVKDQRFLVYFKSIETGESISFALSPAGNNEFDSSIYPAGEYELEKCVLYNEPNIEYEVISTPENLIIKEDDYTFYTFRIDEVSTSHGTEEWDIAKKHMDLNKVIIALVFVFIIGGIAWIVLAIQGRKNYFKKAIADLVKHLLFFILGLGFGIMMSWSINSIPAIYTILFFACFPFGVIAVLMWRARHDDIFDPNGDNTRLEIETREFRSERENNTRFGCNILFIVLAMIIASIVGIILCPTILIKDIIAIIKNRHLNYKQ